MRPYFSIGLPLSYSLNVIGLFYHEITNVQYSQIDNSTVAMYIDKDIKDQAKEKLKDWFGDNVDTFDIDAKIG